MIWYVRCEGRFIHCTDEAHAYRVQLRMSRCGFVASVECLEAGS